MFNEIIGLISIFVLNITLNSMLLQEYKNDFRVLQKRWGKLSFLFIGWIFMGCVIISTLLLVLFLKTFEGIKLALKK